MNDAIESHKLTESDRLSDDELEELLANLPNIIQELEEMIMQ